MDHTYYIPKRKRVYGTHADDHDTVAMLYALYMRHATDVIGRYDGSSLCDGDNGVVKLERRIRIAVGCNGTGTGRVFDVDHP